MADKSKESFEMTEAGAEDSADGALDKIKNDVEKVKNVLVDSDQHQFTRLDLILGIVGAFQFFIDFGTDIKIIVRHAVDEEWGYFAAMTAVVGVSYFATMIVCIAAFTDHSDVRPAWWVVRVVLLILGLSSVCLTAEYLYYGWKSRKDPKQKLPYLKKATYYAYMRLVQSVFEAGPALILQLLFVFREKPNESTLGAISRGASIVTSWISLASSALSFYERILRVKREKRDVMKMTSQIFYTLWHMFETGARVLSFALFLTEFRFWVFLVIGPHYVAMTTWLIVADDIKDWRNLMYDVFTGYIANFYVNFSSRPSRYMYVVYYVIFYAENFLMLGLWAGMTSDDDSWFYIPGIITVCVMFVLNIVTQLLFYRFFHPSGKGKKCMKFKSEDFKASIIGVRDQSDMGDVRRKIGAMS